jgi:hypothetical protein
MIGKTNVKNQWKISVPSHEKERIAITYGDPADALIAVEDYALYPLPEAITNWHAIVPLLITSHWYDVTAFYSRRKMDLNKEDSKLLSDFNQKAFDAAKEKGGLVLYYQGVLLSNTSESINPDLMLPFIPNCMSFCIWNTLQEAKEGAKIPEHKKASQMTSLWFDGFAIKKYQVMLEENSGIKKLTFQETHYS